MSKTSFWQHHSHITLSPGSGIAGQNTQFFPHKGVLSPAENSLYVSYSDGAGPYDGTLGAIFKYNITSGTWTNITPVSGSDLYFGFGGVGVDHQNPGTIMVAGTFIVIQL